MEVWQSQETIFTWLIIAIGIVALLAVSIVLIVRAYLKRVLRNKEAQHQLKLDHQMKLAAASLEIQERERERIAADLHDELIGSLNQTLLTHHNNDKHAEVSTLLERSIATARRISHDLSPPLISQQSFEEIIQGIIQPYRPLLKISLRTEGPADKEMTTSKKLQLMRIIQELITNTTKHAKASELSTYLKQTSNYLGILVRDNGIGFNTEKAMTGLGMRNIEMRINQLSGKYKLRSGNKGTSFFILIPQENV